LEATQEPVPNFAGLSPCVKGLSPYRWDRRQRRASPKEPRCLSLALKGYNAVMSETQTVYIGILAEPTPNPETMKFILDRAVASHGSADFPRLDTAEKSPLAKRLFALGDVAGVFLGANFVTVTRQGDMDWDELIEKVKAGIREHYKSGEPIMIEEKLSPASAAAQTELDKKIIEILDSQVRPAVAGDGGDITFMGFKEGVVYLQLQGSCSGCPSSTMTLKMGIERMLKSMVPEVKSVEAI